MDILTNGILFGLVLACFIGPVFFALIQTSIQRGFYSGAAMAMGICLSDIIYISISYIGISQVIQSESLRAVFSVAGGGMMLALGLSSFRKPVLAKSKQSDSIEPQKLWRYAVKGFLLNGVNPFVLLFWITVVSITSVEYNYTGVNAQLFFGMIILTVFITDLLKSYTAHRLRIFITERYITILNRVVGVALMAFAARLFYSGLAFSFLPF